MVTKFTEQRKFVLRMPTDLHEKVATVAFETHIAMNGFILQAISEKLKRGDHLDAIVAEQRRSEDDGR